MLKHLPNFALIFSNFMEIPTRFMTSMAVVVDVVVDVVVVVVVVVVLGFSASSFASDAISLASGTLFSIGGEHRQHDTETTKETIKNTIFMMMMMLLLTL